MTGTPVICLDEIWRPNWTPDNLQEFRALVEEAHAADDWISDGNFSVATFDLRLPRATHVLWLECPRLTCAWRAIRRVSRGDEHHKARDLPKVLRFILSFNRVNSPRIEDLRMKYGPNVPVIRWNTHRDNSSLLTLLGDESG